jgi:hypothetical protein
MVAMALLDWVDEGRPGDAPGSEGWFLEQAVARETEANWPGRVSAIKGGFGRLPSPPRGRLQR